METPSTSNLGAVGSGEPPNARFLPTRKSLLARAASDSDEIAQPALEELCQIYWYPLYAFTRSRGSSPEDAKDLTQGFLARFLAREDFQKADLRKGKLRAYLRVSMKNYMKSEFRRANRIGRGGQFTFLSIDELEAEARYGQLPVSGMTPEKIYDRQWAITLLLRVMERLRIDYDKAGKSDQFEALRELIPKYSRDQPVALIARKLNLREDTVRVYAHRLRQRYSALLREEIAHTIPDPSEVQAEIDYLLSLFS